LLIKTASLAFILSRKIDQIVIRIVISGLASLFDDAPPR